MERVRRRDPVAAAAYGRLVVALLLSVALHVLVAARPPQTGSHTFGPVLRPVIHARLELPAPRAVERPLSLTLAAVDNVRDRGIAAPVPAVAEPQAYESAIPVAAEPGFALPDLVYYPASELDVYPVPVSPITISALDSARAAGTSGRIRLWVSIDETGWPAAVEVQDAHPAGLSDAAAIAALRMQRFSPASKDGRPVRSRVLIELQLSTPSD
ncbi:MAG: energy transducer TonB [Burkholderiales bacterium]